MSMDAIAFRSSNHSWKRHGRNILNKDGQASFMSYTLFCINENSKVRRIVFLKQIESFSHRYIPGTRDLGNWRR